MKKTYSIRLSDIDIQILDKIGKELHEEMQQDGIEFKATRSALISAVIFDFARRRSQEKGIPLSEYVYWADEQ